MKFLIAAITVFLCLNQAAMAQQTIPLYKDAIPNSKPSPNEEATTFEDGITIVSKITVPTLSIYPAPKEKATGTAVIIFPGGGYWINAIGHEGIDIAKRFNEMGITAFVVKYRIPNDATMINKEIGPLQDAQQAIKTVRQRAKEFNIDEHRIGIIGFSAGGHLASTAGTHFTNAVIDNKENISLRPDFLVLIYPVISFKEGIGHMGSRDQLIGKQPSAEKINYYSNEMQVTEQTPPAFLVHASDDNAVPSANSILFYEALMKYKIPAELHIYEKGGHGFGLHNKTTEDDWMERCKNWLVSNGWLKH
jgi:acetyl esterase/lipase